MVKKKQTAFPRNKTLAVIGIGRVGLPFSLILADEGFRVIGIDRNPRKHQILSSGRMPFKEEGAEPLLKKHYGKTFTLGSINDLKQCGAIIICVGTFLREDRTPDLSDVFSLLDQILPEVKENTLLILRSTVQPHGTEEVLRYIQKKTKKHLPLVYAPERISEGFAIKELYSLPQIIGTDDKTAFTRAAALFKPFAPEVIHTDALTAELAKLVLNTHRYASFAMANELMMIVEYFGRNIYDVLSVANKNYARGNIPTPGFAAGPCLVKDSFFLRYGTPYNTLITGSYTMNENVTEFLVSQIHNQIELNGKKVAVLGLAFKKNIDDDRGSLSLKLISQLQARNCIVTMHDPYLANTNLKDTLHGVDAVILAVDHDEYKLLSVKKIEALVGKKVFLCDLWNVLGTQKIFLQGKI